MSTSLLDQPAQPQQLAGQPRRVAPPSQLTSFVRWLPLLGFVVAVTLWWVALAHTNTTALGSWGLLSAFPVIFYVATAICVAVLCWGLSARGRVRDGWLAAHLGLLIVILYGSASFVADAPRLPWVYKHIAVTRYLELHGSLDPSIDIYQRWPGFFAWTAQLGQLIGYPDPVSYARLIEPAFALLDAVLVLAIARRVMQDRHGAFIATFIFVVSNWVGQNYFAPQAFAYTLELFICLLLLTTMRTEPRRLGRWFERLANQLFRTTTTDAEQVPSPAPAARRWVMAAVLGCFFVIVASHQLTPYLLLLALIPLFVVGYLRPLLLGVAMAALCIIYLLPNLSYVEDKFGLFSSFDPVSNAVYTTFDRATLLPASVLQGRGSQLISGVVLLLALVGLCLRIRAGGARSAIIVAWFLVAPALILAVQSYGDEGRLRVFLFALPWISIAGAWAFRPTRSSPVHRRSIQVAMVALLTALTALFVFVYFQPERDLRVPKTDVVAAQWLDQRAERRDIALAVATFPALIGPHYDDITPETLSDYKIYYRQAINIGDLQDVIYGLTEADRGKRTYVIFSDNQLSYAKAHGLYAPGELARLEAQVAQSKAFNRVYDSGAVRIYTLR